MDGMEWVRESWLDMLALTEDWMRSSEYKGDIEMYCSNSILAVGDPVKITGPECNGQVGELAVIEDEDVYGVWLDTVGQEMFFSREEIEKVSPEQVLFDEAYARAQALGRPFEDEEVFGFIWEQGIELVPQMDSRFVLHQEATKRTRRLWSVVNMAELPF